ncbi:hypothetical protein PV416_19835 [Streptomyces ipomoeae]|uniref:DUF6668 family protein n=1 Tax=Streptomyces ipomoeae TaxID=103232 RepID=UPI001F45AFBC|nr:DUF6668 family protein [Streptomyces ipomoeae]MDX2698443.1 hypothetical protein [Streptomyces ipomoeae]MDX2823298.1 hypothetical protein [Streptomyces ipomoeae]MDX2844046.1 hypothetical protein [Streptomyces ipomoeae]MDX2878323.1 hypothetical protein [Streptomyces ipomoeae]
MQGNTPSGPEIWLRGPVTTPEQSAPAPPVAEVPSTAHRLAWVAAHGGAGTSTLAAVFGGIDAGRNWPRPDQGEPNSILLAARTHAAGLQAVSWTLDLFRRDDQPPGLKLAAVVLVADAPGRLPRQLLQRIKVIGSAIEVHRVPWVPAWRTGDLTVPAPRETEALARLLAEAPRPPERP